MHALWFVCSEHHGSQQAALNDFDLNTYYKTAVEFTYEELMTQRKGKSATPDRRNMGYYAASQALRVRGKGDQIKWHPAVRAYFTGAHADPRDETGTEVPEDMSDTMIEAWASENAAEQAVLVAFAASLTRPRASRTATTRVSDADVDWVPFSFADRAALLADAHQAPAVMSKGAKKRRKGAA